MSSGIRDAMSWLNLYNKSTISSSPHAVLGGVGKFDLSSLDDETQEIFFDPSWWEEAKEDLEKEKRRQKRGNCECGSWMIKDYQNCHSYYCPEYTKKDRWPTR